VRILLNKTPKSGNTEHEIRWNGKNNKGMFVPPVMYLFVIETVGQESLSGRIMVAD
jgi:flagellar hook assembly protein FlgD